MSRHVTRVEIADVDFYSEERKAEIIAGYPEHEREARARGIPVPGSGVVFPVAESSIVTAPFATPDYWAHIGGLDFGWDHPSAAVKLAHDRDADCLYVTHCYRRSEQTPLIHAAAIKPWGDDGRGKQWLPWAWPHDGLQHDKQSGAALKDAYAAQGLKMLPVHAQFDDGSTGVEAGVMDMLERMQTGRLKVFAHLEEWLDEFRQYHRKDGVIVKVRDDLLSATRYALMMRRFAVAAQGKRARRSAQSADTSFDVHSWG